MSHPELVDEQDYLDHAYRCLEAMRVKTSRLADIAESAAQATDSAAAQFHLQRRAHSLDTDVDGLSFGRLDEEDGARWYVGRRHVEDQRGEPVVVDWRADVSIPFYRATPADPLGLHRRRRFLMSGRTLDDLFDEVFDDPDSVDAAHHGGIPDPLLAELERSRTGEMRDIVATIAAEQDLVIRAPLDTCLVVQGGPGTGKTAVGLHRAAFLLYEHRGRLDREGVLVIGPNPLFLRYIAQVLPSLGEAATRQTTVDRLLAGTAYRIRSTDTDAVARLKGDPRMARVLERAVRATRRQPEGDLIATTRWGTVRLSQDDVETAIKEIEARDVPHAVGRNALRTQLTRMVRQDLAARRGEELASAAELETGLRGDRDWQRDLDRIWPTLSAPALVRRLYSSPTTLAEAAAGILDAAEQAQLRRPAARKIDDESWTEPDVIVLDEAQWLIAGTPQTYGHIVVDEAQDLSALALRALARRCPGRSMTVLGDLAQATGPAAQSSWEAVTGLLGGPANAQRVDLDLGYRVPAPIMEVANRLLAVAAPDVVPCRSVRPDGAPPLMVRAEGEQALMAEVHAAAARLAAEWSSLGIIVPDELDVLRRDLPGTVIRPMEAKGLEFDAVLVVEPDAVAWDRDDPARGLRLLYVALTRAVQELVVVHARPLPAALAEVVEAG
ncbi:MAG TPA: ATP-binding domain-containing protein [Acidimicrobiales bacterium]|jgi:DNA helicase IV